MATERTVVSKARAGEAKSGEVKAGQVTINTGSIAETPTWLKEMSAYAQPTWTVVSYAQPTWTRVTQGFPYLV